MATAMSLSPPLALGEGVLCFCASSSMRGVSLSLKLRNKSAPVKCPLKVVAVAAPLRPQERSPASTGSVLATVTKGGSSYKVSVVIRSKEDNLCMHWVELELQSSINKTGSTWHIELDGSMYDRYGYRCMGESSWDKGNRFHARRILLDPYAKTLAPILPGQESLPSPAVALGLLSGDKVQFDWGDDVHLDIPLEELIVYRLNVTGFTADASSALTDNVLGTFDGLLDKAQHFKSLGVNCIILQPIFFFEKRKNSYFPLSFFAPMDCFGPEKTSASSGHSLKRAIKELHKNQIEVLLDVVFCHTGENNDEAPETVSFRGIDNATYYILDRTGRVTGSDLGAENSFSCNHPVPHTMILDSLRHWVVEYHVDGFCFLNASALTKGPHGEELSRPLLVEAISFDPLLSHCKLFADNSSPFTGMTKDIKFPHWKRWCLWNNRYREDVRQFMRGDKGQLSRFATRLCGSGDMVADGRGPSFSLNHVTGPYGLTLVDLVSYSASIEADSERSWNCGEEGRTLKQGVLNIRVKQVRNYLMCLFLSQGIPVLNMGDECGLSKGGSLLVDQRRYYNWDGLKLDFGKQTSHLIAALASFRSRRKDLFQRKDFVRLENIQWHGVQINEPDWENLDSSFIAVSLISDKASTECQIALGDIYIGFNSGNVSVIASLPEPPTGMSWHRIADTSLPFPQYFQEHGLFLNFAEGETRTYHIQPYSSILLEARTLAEI
ncbi:hypothetical protein GOP47_0018100 [Adiantum capillus-veneris]|uniref:Glycosyl hydrolase family 13 catalytic domain-containing protein n=1 Tax=Adiantum capillus-veneris TaxID=13818 RepID=A0A9D4UH49_ADICA|nr:hypothetical protein GOP47_0018100 [Adiantum capillus-veneris]